MDQDKKAKAVKNCETCRKPFGITRIRHTCKRCNKIICADCTKGRIKIVTYDLKTAHKACIACEEEHHFQVNFKTSHQTSWNTLSKMGQRWLKYCNPQQTLAKADPGSEESYKAYLEMIKNPDTKSPSFATIDADITQGKADRERFNFSLQDFLYNNQQKVKPDQIRASVTNVLKAFALKFHTVGYSQNMIPACVFLLSLMDEESAFWTLGYVVTQMLPGNFYGQQELGISSVGYQQEKYVLSNLIKDELKLSQEMSAKISTLLDINGPTLLAPLLVNYTNFQVLYEAWDNMLSRKTFSEIRKAIIQLVKTFLPKIEKKSMMNPIEFHTLTLRFFNIADWKEGDNIKIKADQVKLLELRFRGDFSGQGTNKDAKMQHALRRVTAFNKDQVRVMRENFQDLLMTRPRISTNKLSVSMMEDADGIDREDFKKLILDVMSRDPESHELSATMDFDQLFDSFDFDKSGKLDFKEFLFMVSMVLKGNLEEKLQAAFYVFDSADKGFLNGNEFENFIHMLIQATVKANQETIDSTFNEELEKFSDKMSTLYEKDQIEFDKIKKDLTTDKFIKHVGMIESKGRADDGLSKMDMAKEVMVDTSIHFNQTTVMDTTQDTSSVLAPHNNVDLTGILDTTEQSTIQEVEESKLEGENNEDLLSEAQRETMLGSELASPHKGSGSIEETKGEETPKKAQVIESDDNTEVEYVHTQSAKSLIARFNKPTTIPTAQPKGLPERKYEPKSKVIAPKPVEAKPTETTEPPKITFTKTRTDSSDSDNEVNMRELMAKWKSSPQKGGKTPANMDSALNEVTEVSSKSASPVKGRSQMDFETVYDNFLPALGAESSEDPNHRPELSFNFAEDTAIIDKHTLAAFDRVLNTPIKESNLVPFSHEEVDVRPADISEATSTFFEKVSALISEIPAPVSASPHIKKPVSGTHSNPLAVHIGSDQPFSGGWAENCFESKEAPIFITEIHPISKTIGKPFADNPYFTPSPEQEQVEIAPPQFWRPDELEFGDKPMQIAQPVAPIKPIRKPISTGGFAQVLLLDELLDTPTFDSFASEKFSQIDTPAQPSEAINPAKTIRKPFAVEGKSNLLPAQSIEERPLFEAPKDNFFETFSQPSSFIQPVTQVAKIAKPFETATALSPLSQEQISEALELLGWKQDCFESNDKMAPLAEAPQSLKRIANPFAGGSYQALPVHHVDLVMPALEGWKDDCFSFNNQPAVHSEACKANASVKKPFTGVDCKPLAAPQVSESVSVSVWQDGVFEQTDKSIATFAIPSFSQPLSKPIQSGGELTPLIPDALESTQPTLGEWKENCFESNDDAISVVDSASLGKIAKNPFAGGSYGALATPLGQLTMPVLEAWKDDCFSFNDKLVSQPETCKTSSIVQKPFTGGDCQPLVYQQTSDTLLTTTWKDGAFEHADTPVSALSLSSASQPLRKPLQTGGELYPLSTDSVGSTQPTLGSWREDSFSVNDKSIAQPEVCKTNSSIKKPFAGSAYQPLVYQQTTDTMFTTSWKDAAFEQADVPISASTLSTKSQPLRKPLQTGGELYPLSQYSVGFTQPTLDGWKEDPFVINNHLPTHLEACKADKPVKKPFEGGEYKPLVYQQEEDIAFSTSWKENAFGQADHLVPASAQPIESQPLRKPLQTGGELYPLSQHSVGFTQPTLDGWKEDPFVINNHLTTHLEACKINKPVKKPFEGQEYKPLVYQEKEEDIAFSTSWREDAFGKADRSVPASAHPIGSQPLRKPLQTGGELYPLPPSPLENDVAQLESKLFETVSEPSTAASPASVSIHALPINKPIFDNNAQQLEMDQNEVEAASLFDAVKSSSAIPEAHAHESATVSPIVKKIERQVFENHATPLNQTVHEGLATTSSTLFNNDNGARELHTPVQRNNAVVKIMKPPQDSPSKTVVVSETQSPEVEEINKIRSSTYVLDRSPSEEQINIPSTVEWRERGGDIVIERETREEQVIRRGQEESSEDDEDKPVIVPEEEHKKKVIYQTSTEQPNTKQIIIDDDDDEAGGLDSTFMNPSAINGQSHPMIYGKIDESTTDSSIAEKRRVNKGKDAMAEGKGAEACKMCNMF